MTRTPLMAGNWKMNLDHHQAIHLVQKLALTLKDAKHDVSDVEVLDRVVEDLILVHDRPADGELRDALRQARTVLAPGRVQTHG